MIGVPAASAATTALLFLVGIAAVVVGVFLLRRRAAGLTTEGRVVAAVLALSLVAVPWLAWRFAEDVSTTTGYDSYQRASAGPIQAYLPGYLVDGARSRIPAGATWSAAVGPGAGNAVARKAFPALVLTTLFPRVSAPAQTASWLVAWGVDPRRVARVSRVEVAHPRQGTLPPVLVAKARR
jgi:hypothetical protein